MHLFWHRLHFTIWTILVLLLGYALGTFLMVVEEASAPGPIRMTDRDLHRRLPVVNVREIQEGDIVGTVGTGARLVIGEELITPAADRSFHVPAEPFLVNIIDVPIPRGVQFVASKRGKNYYPVTSSEGQRLVPENRLYFRTAQEAEALSYKRGK